MSSLTACKTDVSQGSVLGPVLFSRYISPITHIVTTRSPNSAVYRRHAGVLAVKPNSLAYSYRYGLLTAAIIKRLEVGCTNSHGHPQAAQRLPTICCTYNCLKFNSSVVDDSVSELAIILDKTLPFVNILQLCLGAYATALEHFGSLVLQ